jgi:hypothetical protein
MWEDSFTQVDSFKINLNINLTIDRYYKKIWVVAADDQGGREGRRR